MKDEIIKLGWKLMNNPSTIGFHFVKNYNRIWFNAEDVDNYSKIARGIEIVFIGYIKTKEELELILKMVDINE